MLNCCLNKHYDPQAFISCYRENLYSLGLNTIARPCNQPRCLSINEQIINTYTRMLSLDGWYIQKEIFISLQESSEKECTQFMTKRWSAICSHYMETEIENEQWVWNLPPFPNLPISISSMTENSLDCKAWDIIIDDIILILTLREMVSLLI